MFLNSKWGKMTIAGSILTTTLFSTSHPTLASAGGQAPDSQNANNSEAIAMGNTKNPKNVIFLIGDGMGPSFNTAYRYYADNPKTKEMDKTAFDNYLKGTMRVHNDDDKENITDSAAAGTALSTGKKTFNGAIGVDNNKQAQKTVLEQAKESGKSTGLVSTAEITDATPAAYAAHVDDRDKKDEIAKQFYNDKINGQHKVDVLLGGGSKYFGKENGNLDKKFKKDGYDIVSNKNELANSKSDQVLGLFAEENMPLQIDAPKKNPMLDDMQQSALNKLEKNNNGFFLMVEGASIDKTAHANDVTGVMSEMDGFNKAFENAMSYAENRDDTLVIATADHSTGGMTIGSGEEYKWNPDAIHKMNKSGAHMTEQIAEGKDVEKVIKNGYGFDVKSKQIDKIKDEADKLKDVKDKAKNEDDPKIEKQQGKLQDAIQKPINDKSRTGWTTYGHTGEDVNTYAYGPGSDFLEGNVDNTDQPKNLFDFFSSDVTSS